MLTLDQKINGTINYLAEEIKGNDLMSEKHKKGVLDLKLLCTFSSFVSAATGCVSVSALPSLVTPEGITRAAIGLKIGPLTTATKRHNSVIKKKGKSTIE